MRPFVVVAVCCWCSACSLLDFNALDGQPGSQDSSDVGPDATLDSTTDSTTDGACETTSDAIADTSIDSTVDSSVDSVIDSSVDADADADSDTGLPCPKNAVLCEGFDGPTLDPAWAITTMDSTATIGLDRTPFGAETPPSVLAKGGGSPFDVDPVAGIYRRIAVKSKVSIDLAIGQLSMTDVHRLVLLSISPIPLPSPLTFHTLGLTSSSDPGVGAAPLVTSSDGVFFNTASTETLGGGPKQLHLVIDYAAGTYTISVDKVPLASDLSFTKVPGIVAIDLAIGLLSSSQKDTSRSTVRFDTLIVTID